MKLVDLLQQMDPTSWLLEKETLWMVVGSIENTGSDQVIRVCVSLGMGRMEIFNRMS